LTAASKCNRKQRPATDAFAAAVFTDAAVDICCCYRHCQDLRAVAVASAIAVLSAVAVAAGVSLF